MNPDQLHRRVIEIVLEVADVDLSVEPPDADLFEVGLDSLQFASIVVELEDGLDITLTPESLDRFASLEQITLDDVVQALYTSMSPGG